MVFSVIENYEDPPYLNSLSRLSRRKNGFGIGAAQCGKCEHHYG